ncbi:MAG: outer membrane beta-barrel protein, partial [Cyclobacteriaceae bacterium]
MKKLLVIVCLIAAVGFLQEANAQAQFAIGVKGGLNFSKLDVSQGASNIDNRSGFHGGAFGLIKFSKIGIQPEIIFSKQGSNFDFNSAD